MVTKHGLINPHRVYKACEYLIKNHPDYQNIKLENYQDWVLKCPTLFDETEKSEEEDNQNSSDEESAETSGGNNSEMNEKSQQEGEDNNFNAITFQLCNNILVKICAPMISKISWAPNVVLIAKLIVILQ